MQSRRRMTPQCLGLETASPGGTISNDKGANHTTSYRLGHSGGADKACHSRIELCHHLCATGEIGDGSPLTLRSNTLCNFLRNTSIELRSLPLPKKPLFQHSQRSRIPTTPVFGLSCRNSALFRVSVPSPLLGGYDVPEALPYQIPLNCPIGADFRHALVSQRRR